MASPTEMRDFIEQYVGPMVLTPDGEIVRKDPENNTAPAEAEVVVKRPLARARYATRHIRTAFWQRFKRIA